MATIECGAGKSAPEITEKNRDDEILYRACFRCNKPFWGRKNDCPCITEEPVVAAAVSIPIPKHIMESIYIAMLDSCDRVESANLRRCFNYLEDKWDYRRLGNSNE